MPQHPRTLPVLCGKFIRRASPIPTQISNQLDVRNVTSGVRTGDPQGPTRPLEVSYRSLFMLLIPCCFGPSKTAPGYNNLVTCILYTPKGLKYKNTPPTTSNDPLPLNRPLLQAGGRRLVIGGSRLVGIIGGPSRLEQRVVRCSRAEV